MKSSKSDCCYSELNENASLRPSISKCFCICGLCVFTMLLPLQLKQGTHAFAQHGIRSEKNIQKIEGGGAVVVFGSFCKGSIYWLVYLLLLKNGFPTRSDTDFFV